MTDGCQPGGGRCGCAANNALLAADFLSPTFFLLCPIKWMIFKPICSSETISHMFVFVDQTIPLLGLYSKVIITYMGNSQTTTAAAQARRSPERIHRSPRWAGVSMATGSSPRELRSPLAKAKQAPPTQSPRLRLYSVMKVSCIPFL